MCSKKIEIMTTSRKTVLILSLIILSIVLESCSSARWGTNAGVNVTWGPNGPKVKPHVDLNIYNGGRL